MPLALLLVLTLAHTAAAQPTSSTQDDRAEQLLSCLPKDCAGRRTVWDHMLQHTPPCIGGQGVWYTKHKPRLPITLVTQLSSNRLQALQAQCQSWAGPLAAAVFVPLFNPGPASSKELSLQSKQRLARAVAAVEEVMTWAEDLAQRTQATAAALSAGQDLATLLKDIPQNASARDRPRASCQLSIILLYEVYQQVRSATDSHTSKDPANLGSTLRTEEHVFTRVYRRAHTDAALLRVCAGEGAGPVPRQLAA